MLGLDRAQALCEWCGAWVRAALFARERRNRQSIQRGRAEERSLSLLLTLLSPEQRNEFQTCGFFHVTGGRSGDRYRIRFDSAVNIDVLGQDGKIKYHLCARPSGDIPMYDVMAGQMLFLQDRAAETRFLDQAKKHLTLLFPAMLH